jgi:hypothetical protein
MKYWFLLLLPLAFLACRKDPMKDVYHENEAKVTLATGVWGTVSFREGNCMPGYNRRSCKEGPVRRTVQAFAATRVSEATKADPILNGFFTSFTTAKIAETVSDSDGFFQLSLPPGTYTLVVVEEGKLYARSYEGSDPDKTIHPVTVGNGPLRRDIVIDYKAAY